MKKLLILCASLFLIYSLYAQDCHRAAWAKAFGGTSLYNGITDGGRRSDGTFTVCGSFGADNMVLGGVTIPDSGYYNCFLANHDSSGTFFNGALVAWYSNSSDIFQVKKIDVGSDNSVYITGYWRGSTVHIANVLLPTATRNRTFVAKFNTSLQHKWTRKSDWMSADCQGNDVASDLDKNVYITGNFEDNAFKIGNFVVENYGGNNMWRDDCFLIKFDSLGNTQYLNHFGTPNDETALTIVADSMGDVIIIGSTSSSTSDFLFDEHTAIPGGTGSYNMFLAKFNGADGHCIWGKMASGYNTNDQFYPWDACLADNNSVLFCGQITGQINFYPHTYTSADANGYLAKIDTDGNSLWLSIIGGVNSSESANRISYYNGLVAVSGSLYSNHPYVGDYPLYSTLSGGSFKAFNAMLNTSGETLWARGNNPSSSTYYNGCVLIDNSGNQLLWGYFKSTQTWYPVSLTNSLSNFKLFLVKFHSFSPPSSFAVSAGPDKIATCGSAVQLTGSTTPSNLTTTGWWPNLGFSSNGIKTPSVNPGFNNTYYLYASYLGCVSRDTVNVTYSNADISVNAGTDVNFCGGDSVHIITSCNQPTATFSWSPIKYINTSTSQNPYVKPPLTTQYIVTASYGGCNAIDTITVYARGKPYISLPKQDLYYNYWRTHLCSGDTMNLNFGNPVNNYTVTTPSMVTNVNNNLASLLPLSGLLKVSALNPYGCPAKDSVNVIIHNNLPPPPIEGLVADRSVCPGDSVNFNIHFTNSINYSFQYSWYSSWQIDSLDGSGWHDISYWDNDYEPYAYSVGYPTSNFYSTLRIFLVNPNMNGFKFRPYIHDYCSARAYGNTATLYVGPKITSQPLSENFCEGVTDSISVNTSTSSPIYQWEIKQGNTFVPFVDIPGALVTNGRFLKIINADMAIDSTWVRCRLQGCTPLFESLSDSALIRVIPQAQIEFQSPDDSICAMDTSFFTVIIDNPQLYTYTWYENNNPLTYNTSQISGINTNTLHFTPVYSNQNNYTYKLKITNTQCGTSVFSNPVRFYVNAAPTVTWPGNNGSACVNGALVPLSGATPAGGTYTGNYVVGGAFFNPAGLSSGNYPVIYYYTDTITGCTNYVTKYFTVNNPPVASWSGGDVIICENQTYASSVTGGTPGGGIIEGPGVFSGHYFHPDSAGLGTHILMYIVTNATTGCKDTAFKNYIVVPAPNVSWAGGTVTYCANEPAFSLNGGLPPGGSYSGTGVSNNIFSPANAGNGSHVLTYFYMDGNNCSGYATRDFYVDPCTGIQNPNTEKLEVFTKNNQIIFTQVSYFENSYDISIYNALGQDITTKEFTGDCIRCTLSDLSIRAGFYTILFSDGIKQKIFKILMY